MHVNLREGWGGVKKIRKNVMVMILSIIANEQVEWG